MPSVQDTQLGTLAEFSHNRRELFQPVYEPSYTGNRNEVIPTTLAQEITSLSQVFPSENLITFDTGNAGISSEGSAGNSIRGWAGATFANRGVAPFRYDQDGNVWATAIFIGSASTIAGFNIGADYIRDAANSMGLASTVSGSNDVRFWAGATFADRSTTAPIAIYENGYMTLGSPASTHIQLDGPNARIRSSNYVANTSGFNIDSDLVEAENIRARGIMKGVTFQYDVISAVGGQLIVANSDTLSTDMTALDASTLTITGATTFAVNDMLHIKAITASGIQEEYLRVTSAASAPTYSVTRDLAASFASNSNPIWLKGTTVVKEGKSDGAATYSGGWLRLFGEGTNSPYYSVFSRTGLNYNSYSERVRLGNLNGVANYAADVFGIFIGDYSGGNYLTYDDVSGLLTVNGRALTADPIFGDGSDGNVTIAAGTTTLTRDMFYDALIVNGTVVPNGYRIYCKTSATVNNGGIINLSGNNGGAGGNASGSTPGIAGVAGAALGSGSIYGGLAGAAGAAGGFASGTNGVAGTNATISLTNSAGSAGGAGGNGNNGSGGTSGAGGTISSVALASPRNLVNGSLLFDSANSALYRSSGGAGSGGGGAGGASNSAGGGGGAGGGNGGMGVIAARTITVNSGGIIRTNGGNGGNGGNGSSDGGAGVAGGGGGGGGGGSGGVLVLIYTTYTNNGTVTASAGTKGTGGSRGAAGGGAPTNGADGADGSAGLIIPLQLS